MLADLPVVPQRVNRDFSRIDFIVRVLATGKPVISAPLLGVTTRQPLIVIAVPILGADGKVIGMLNGTIDLLRPNFLGGLANAKIGKTGYFYILTKEARPIVVIHPRQDSILGAAPGPAENPSTARALAGFEGTLEGTNSAGMRGLFSYKSLTEVNWLLAAVLPADEAFGQIGETVRCNQRYERDQERRARKRPTSCIESNRPPTSPQERAKAGSVSILPNVEVSRSKKGADRAPHETCLRRGSRLRRLVRRICQ